MCLGIKASQRRGSVLQSGVRLLCRRMGSDPTAALNVSLLSASVWGGGGAKGQMGCIFVKHVLSRMSDSDKVGRSQGGTGVTFSQKTVR